MCQGHDQVVLCTEYHTGCLWVTLSQAVPVFCQGWTSSSSQAAQETGNYLNPGFSCGVSQQDPITSPFREKDGCLWLPFGAQMGEAWPRGLHGGWVQEGMGMRVWE